MVTHIGTMPYKLFEMLLKHPLTDRSLETFASDWEKVPAMLGRIGEAAVMSKVGR